MLHAVTPLVESEVLSQLVGHRVMLKMDAVQPSGSFKIRGLGYMAARAKERGCTRLVTSSGGNAGLACAFAAKRLGLKCLVVVPSTTPELMRAKIRLQGAEVVQHGSVWDEANEYALQAVKEEGSAYVPPFDDPDIWTGNASLSHELKSQLSEKPSAVVLSVGGGGLMCGVIQGLHEVGWGDVPVIAMETDGANCLNSAVQAGKPVTIPAITSIAKSLGSKTICKQGFDWTLKHRVISKTVSDKTVVEVCRRFLDDHCLLVEPACAAALAAVYNPSILRDISPPVLVQGAGPVVVVVCGGSAISLAMLRAYEESFALAAENKENTATSSTATTQLQSTTTTTTTSSHTEPASQSGPEVLFYSRSGKDWLGVFRTVMPEARVREFQPGDNGPADFIVAHNPPGEMMAARAGVRAVFNIGAGVDGMMTALQSPHAGTPSDIPVYRLEDAGMAVQMSGYVAHAVLHHFRSADIYAAQQAAERWEPHKPVRQESSIRVGVLGYGKLGQHVASTLAGLGYRVSAWKRTPAKSVGDERVAVLCGKEQLAEFLRGLDCLVNLLPLTPETENMLNASLFQQLARGALVVNTARGKHVVDADLLAALESGQLSHACIDVTREEPLPAGHPFWKHPRITLTPHVSALTVAEPSMQQIADKIRTIWAGGKVTEGLVDRTVGY
eukprot:m.136783 g.136783  ORF g.136783 m.136783 type:complete len:671 (+) comp16589_c1_seq1:290-2302(+)